MIEPDIQKRYIVKGRDLALLCDSVRKALSTDRMSDIATIAYQLKHMVIEEVRQ